MVLAVLTLLSTLSLVGFSVVEDPRRPLAYIAAVGLGLGQMANIVISLALCADAKRRNIGKAGAIAGSYSFFGPFLHIL